MFKAYKDAMMKQKASGNGYEPIQAVCVSCGRSFTITPNEQEFAAEGKGFVLPKRCPDCRKERKAKTKFLTCTDCGKEFEFKVDDQKFYADHGFQDPKRCPECRQKRKSGGYNHGERATKEDKSE